jgi:hypothetical protein
MEKRSIEDIQAKAHEEFLRESAGWQVDTSGLPSTRDRQRADAEKNKRPEKPLAQPYSREYQPRPNALLRQISVMANAAAKDRRDPYHEDILRVLPANASDVPDGTVIFTISATGEERGIEVRKVDGLWTAHVDGTKITGQTRDVLLSAVSRELNQNVRDLNDAQKRECCVIAMTIGFDAGLIRYLSLRTGFPEDAVRSEFGSLPLDDRKHRLLREGVALCWLAMNTDFSPGGDWSAFVEEYAAGRNYSLPLLNGARVAYEAHRDSIAREALLSTMTEVAQPEEAPPTYRDLDELSDDELSRQLHGVKKEYSRLVRAGQI